MDSKKTARYGLDNWVELRQYSSMDTIQCQLKNINRQLGLFTKSKNALINNLIVLLDQSYLSVNTLFTSPICKDSSQKWVDCVRSVSLNAFTKWYLEMVQASRLLSTEKAAAIHAKGSCCHATEGRNDEVTYYAGN